MRHFNALKALYSLCLFFRKNINSFPFSTVKAIAKTLSDLKKINYRLKATTIIQQQLLATKKDAWVINTYQQFQTIFKKHHKRQQTSARHPNS
jgi:hypothetical protein